MDDFWIPGFKIESQMHDIHKQILSRIRDLMNEGVTIAEIARRCNTHGSKLCNVINNKIELWNMHLRTLVGLAKGLEMTITIKGDERGEERIRDVE